MAQGCWLEKWSVSNIAYDLSTSITHTHPSIHSSKAAIIKRCLLNAITNKSHTQALNAINCLLAHFNWQDIIFHRHSAPYANVPWKFSFFVFVFKMEKANIPELCCIWFNCTQNGWCIFYINSTSVWYGTAALHCIAIYWRELCIWMHQLIIADGSRSRVCAFACILRSNTFSRDTIMIAANVEVRKLTAQNKSPAISLFSLNIHTEKRRWIKAASFGDQFSVMKTLTDSILQHVVLPQGIEMNLIGKHPFYAYNND